MIVSTISIFFVTLFISILLVRGIDFMKENHPDYRGEDLFDEEDDMNVR